MSRKIIQIDEEKCIGCGLCANACKQSAIQIIDGKAKVVRDDYCDGLGNCLPVCPVEAISFSDRDIKAKPVQGGCPGTRANMIKRTPVETVAAQTSHSIPMESQLNQWPVQIKLVPTNAPYFDHADLLIAADCTAYAYGNFHSE